MRRKPRLRAPKPALMSARKTKRSLHSPETSRGSRDGWKSLRLIQAVTPVEGHRSANPLKVHGLSFCPSAADVAWLSWKDSELSGLHAPHHSGTHKTRGRADQPVHTPNHNVDSRGTSKTGKPHDGTPSDGQAGSPRDFITSYKQGRLPRVPTSAIYSLFKHLLTVCHSGKRRQHANRSPSP